ncbi:MAG: hypothetical protein RLP09_09570 [Sandaracinaceae bacterium]
MTQRVLDTETGEVIGVHEADAEAGLRSGRYAVSEAEGPIGLRNEAGERFEVDPQHLGGALEGGFRIETPDEAREAELEAEHGDSGARAFVEGAARELIPGADQFQVAFGGALGGNAREIQESLRERAERNPTASTAGRVVGAVAPALLSGGASTAGRVAAFSPQGAANIAGQGVQQLTRRLGGGQFAARLAGNATDASLGALASSMADAGLTGRPIEGEQLLADVGLSALVGVGAGEALRGLAVGGRRAIEGGERAAEYAQRLARSGLGAGAEARTLRGGIEAAVPARAPTDGLMGRIRSMSGRTGPDADDLAVVAAQPRMAFDVSGFEASTRRAAESISDLGTRIDEAVGALGNAERRQAAFARSLGDVDPADVGFASRQTLGAARRRLQEGLEAFSGRERGGRVVRGVLEDVERQLGRLNAPAPRGPRTGNPFEDFDAFEAAVSRPTTAAATDPVGAFGAMDATVRAIDAAIEKAGDDGARGLLREVRQLVASTASETDAFGRTGAMWSEIDGASQAWREAREALGVDQARLASELTGRGAASSETIDRLGASLEAAEQALQAAERAGVDVAAGRSAVRSTREALGDAITRGEVRGAGERALAADQGGLVHQLATHAAGKAIGRTAGLLGALIGGGPGYAAGRALGTAAELAVEVRTAPAGMYQRIARLGQAVERYAPRVEAGAERLRRALSSGRLVEAMSTTQRTASRVASRLRGAPAERREEYRDVVAQLRTLATDQEQLAGRLSESVGPVDEVAPQLGEALAMSTARAVGYLASQLPPASGVTTLWGDELQPSQFEIDGFLRRYEAIEDPASLLDRAAEGSLHLEHTEAVQAVYPEIYADLSARVTEVLGELDAPPPYALRVQVGTLLGVAADPSMTPAMIDALQSRYAHTGAQYDAQNAPQPPSPTGSAARVGDTMSSQALSGAQGLGRNL